MSERRPSPSRPSHLTGAVADEWDRIVGSMPSGFYSEADVPALTIYCEALTLRRGALADVQRDGRTIKDNNGRLWPHPMLKEADVQADIILKAAQRLRMVPR